jgi:hypothetical protein
LPPLAITTGSQVLALASAAANSLSNEQVLLVAPLVTGWCQGRFNGVVLLDEDPYCPPPAPTGPVRPCRLFATRSLDVGRFSFFVAG